MLVSHRSFSQPTTSFILFFTQGIHSMLLINLLRFTAKNIIYNTVNYLHPTQHFGFWKQRLLQRCESKYNKKKSFFKTFFSFFIFFNLFDQKKREITVKNSKNFFHFLFFLFLKKNPRFPLVFLVVFYIFLFLIFYFFLLYFIFFSLF